MDNSVLAVRGIKHKYIVLGRFLIFKRKAGGVFMPRPRRCRRICSKPQFGAFCPEGCSEDNPIMLTLDEYEVVRLADLEQKTHEQCAVQMDISRSTVQEIYESARRKIAACLVYGKKLVIEGGDYRICGGREQSRCGCCCHHNLSDKASNQDTNNTAQGNDNKIKDSKTKNNKTKGGLVMKIAVTYENGQIFQHFGHTQQFKIYEIADGKIAGSEVIGTGGSGHGALAGFLMQKGVDTLICGGIGGGAQTALANAGIRLYGGVSGDADAAVNALLDGSLGYDPDVHCNHHGHEGYSDCGPHSCH